MRVVVPYLVLGGLTLTMLILIAVTKFPTPSRILTKILRGIAAFERC